MDQNDILKKLYDYWSQNSSTGQVNPYSNQQNSAYGTGWSSLEVARQKAMEEARRKAMEEYARRYMQQSPEEIEAKKREALKDAIKTLKANKELLTLKEIKDLLEFLRVESL